MSPQGRSRTRRIFRSRQAGWTYPQAPPAVFFPPLEAKDAGLRVTEEAPYRWTWPEIGKAVGGPEASVCAHPACQISRPRHTQNSRSYPPEMPFPVLRLPTHQGEEPKLIGPLRASLPKDGISDLESFVVAAIQAEESVVAAREKKKRP